MSGFFFFFFLYLPLLLSHPLRDHPLPLLLRCYGYYAFVVVLLSFGSGFFPLSINRSLFVRLTVNVSFPISSFRAVFSKLVASHKGILAFTEALNEA